MRPIISAKTRRCHLDRAGVTWGEILRPSFGTSVAAPLRSLGPTLEDSAHLIRLRLLARQTQANAKAVVVVAARRRVPAAERRPTTPGGEVPTAATAHAARARCSTTRVRHATTRVISIPILTPLHNIPMHTVQTHRIRAFAAYWMGLGARVLAEPTVIT